ncbi:MAG: tetratricopeptide repeat protein [Methanolobus sp.]|nr:tetratricopeptide repeat protein [Methanolobus sp.]
MSQQKIDTINRKMITASNHFQKSNYKKALKVLEEAEIAAKGEKAPDLLAKILILKGNVLETDLSVNAALTNYDEAFTISSRLFLEEPDNPDLLMILEGSITGIKDALNSAGDIEDAVSMGPVSICEKHGDVFIGVCDVLMEHDIDNEEDIGYHLNYVEALNNILICFAMAQIPKIKVSYVLKVMEKYSQISAMDPDYSDLEIFVQRMAKLYGDFFISSEAFDAAKQVYDKYFELTDRKYKDNPDDMSNFIAWINSKTLIGDHYSITGQIDDAYACFSDILEHVTPRCENGHDSSENDSCETCGFGTDSLEHYSSKRIFCDILAARTYQKIALIFEKEGDIEQAASYFERSLLVFEQMQFLPPEFLSMQADEISSLEHMAEFFENINDLDKAERIYLFEIDVYGGLVKEGMDETDNKLCIAQTFDQLAVLFGENAHLEKADHYFQKEIAIYRDLREEDPDVTDYDEFLAETLRDLGGLYFDSDFEKSLRSYEDALGIFEELVELDESSVMGFANTLKKMAVLYAAYGQFDMSLKHCNKASDILHRLPVEGVSAKGDVSRELADIYFAISNVYEELGDPENEQEYFFRGVDMYAGILHDADLDTENKMIVTMEMMLKEHYYMEVEKYDKAKNLVELYNAFYEDIFANNVLDPELLLSLVVSNDDLGKIHYNLGAFDRSVEYYLRSISLLEDIMDSHPDDIRYLEVMAIVSIRLGMVYKAIDKPDLAKQSFESSLETQARMVEIEPSVNVFNIEWGITCLEEYADVLDRLGMGDEATGYRAQAEELRRRSQCGSDDDPIAFE